MNEPGSALEPVAGTELDALDDPVQRLVAAWLLGFASEHTRRGYTGDVRQWLAFCAEYGIEPLRGARRPHIDAWARSNELAGGRPRTVARRLGAVASWYTFLVAEEVRATSPATHVRRPKIPDVGETPGSAAASYPRE